MADYCKYIPGNGLTQSLVNSTNNYSSNDFYRDLPNYDDVNSLIKRYTDTAVINFVSPTNKDLLYDNTNALNQYVKKETTRINNAVIDILNNKVSPSTNTTGLPTNYDDLVKGKYVYNAKDPLPLTGLDIPYNAKDPHWAGKYPFLYRRIKDGTNITGAECDKFIRDYNFEHDTFKTSLRSGILDPNGTDMLGLLNDFYSIGAFSQTAVGMFCSMVPDIFAQVRELVDMFNSGREMVENVLNFLSQPIAVQYKLAEAAVKAMLERLKEHVITFVEQLAKAANQTVKNITGGWVDPAYIYNHGALSEKFIREKDRAIAFFSKENLNNIKNNIKSSIQYAAGVFERMDLEEIQFLIMRFCELLQNIEQMFFNITSTLSGMVQEYSAVRSLLSGSGDLATAQALAAGATRYDNESRYSGIMEASRMSPYGPIDSSPFAPPGSQIPEDARGLAIEGEPITPEELSAIPTYDEICNGSSKHFAFQSGKLGMGPAGWNNAKPYERVLLMRLADALREQLVINCAYRSPSYNAKVNSVAKSSLHMSGQAFDISMISRNTFSRETFINTAKSVGFRGFGNYQTFIHIDTGRARSWNG